MHDIGDVSERSIAEHGIVVHGFTHQHQMRSEGDSLVINPGEACGWVHGTPTAAVLDLDTQHVEFITLPAEGVAALTSRILILDFRFAVHAADRAPGA